MLTRRCFHFFNTAEGAHPSRRCPGCHNSHHRHNSCHSRHPRCLRSRHSCCHGPPTSATPPQPPSRHHSSPPHCHSHPIPTIPTIVPRIPFHSRCNMPLPTPALLTPHFHVAAGERAMGAVNAALQVPFPLPPHPHCSKAGDQTGP